MLAIILSYNMDSVEQKAFMARANKIDQMYKLADRVEIQSDPDKKLFNYYLGERLLRTSIYESSWILSRPSALTIVRLPILKHLVRALDWFDRDNRRRLAEAHQLISEYIQQNYPDPHKRIRARTIELAVNNIFALGTNTEPTQTRVKIKLSEGILEDWSKRWLGPLNPETHRV